MILYPAVASHNQIPTFGIIEIFLRISNFQHVSTKLLHPILAPAVHQIQN